VAENGLGLALRMPLFSGFYGALTGKKTRGSLLFEEETMPEIIRAMDESILEGWTA
jgi:hypothetical protein